MYFRAVENKKMKRENYLNGHYYLESIVDGKPDDTKRIVNLKIQVPYQKDSKISVFWDGVIFYPVAELKKVKLNAEHYSIKEGTIKDVVLGKNYFSFRIHLPPLFALERSLQIMGERKEGETKYTLTGSSIRTSDLLNRPMKVKWKSVNKDHFVLPYNKIL